MSWFVYDRYYRCLSDPRENRYTYEGRMKAKYSNPAPPTENPAPPTQNPAPPTQNREDGNFTTRLQYSGVMDETCGKQYVDGLVEYIHKCDPDRWSKLEVDDVLEKLGLM